MADHGKKARSLLKDTVVASLSEPGHPHHDTECNGCPESTAPHHDYSYLLAALTHAVLDVADAIRERGAS